jgi:hypothetical protein
MTQDLNNTSAAVDANTAAVGQTEADNAAKAKKNATVAKADLTQDFLKERLELRLEKFVLVGENYVVLPADDTPVVVSEGVSVKYSDETVPEGVSVMSLENFYWKVNTVAAPAGSFAGARRETDGYYSVTVAGTNYSGKQLAEFYRSGQWVLQHKRAEGGEKKPAGEKKPVEVRQFVPLSPAAKQAAIAAKKAADEARKAKKEAAKAAAASAPAVNSAESATPADTSDIPSAETPAQDPDTQVL